MYRPCPICGEAKSRIAFPFATVWNNKKYQYVRCVSCKTNFINPVPSNSDLELIFAKENYHDKYYSVFDVEQYRYSINLLLRLCGKRRKLLDFGCGNGAFLHVAKSAGFYCKGVEFLTETVELAEQNSGVPVQQLESIIASGEQFEIICLRDVFAHLREPEKTFIQLQKSLLPQGVFFIEGPIENNPSLVYYSIQLFNLIQRKLGLWKIGNIPPTILVRTNQKAQRKFFTNKLGYKKIYFGIYETGWPYYSKGAGSNTVTSVIKRVIGYTAILLSGVKIGNRRFFGNKFIGLFEI